MRLLHTSDWHVGRTFHGYSTLEAARTVLGAIPALVREHRIDVVIVAGDVYDLTNPSADAVAVLQEALVAITQTGAKVIVTSGNHDSAVRLGFAGPFTAAAGLHLVTDATTVGTPIELTDEHGTVDVYGLPYLQPELVRHLPWAPSDARTQRDVVTAAMDRVRASIAERATTNTDADPSTSNSPTRRTVAIAHTFVAGAETESSDSERAITKAPLVAGGVDAVPVNAFDGVDYVALGHIHGRAKLAEGIRYSGAALHYSFKEAGKPRGGWLVELGARGVETIEWVDLPVPRALKEIRGTFDELLTAEEWAPFTEHYVRAVYTDKNKQLEPLQRLRARFEHCAEVVHEPTERTAASTASYAERVKGKSDPEVIESFLVDVRSGDGPTATEQRILDAVIAERDAEVQLG
ncbi:exonuclease SbcCD subunit D [uncultured Schumannella sp.]|uniref:exonuclease SbcCD subunit D n=1 Tax=uncultured Schumannella sp. TaxID=1195956 RepID=UPI0025D8C4B4|nr:exonuclease SbcCD subunit D [uncultured Schumannella sp.]